MHNKAKKLSKSQLNALAEYRDAYGHHWKSRLKGEWIIGTDAVKKNGAFLRQIRNEFGPLWLDRFRFK